MLSLFDDSPEETINFKTLLEIIRGQRDEFKTIFVRRFTHVKNLGSSVLHEYLHVILEDTSTDKWTRVIVERQAAKLIIGEAHDQMIIRRWPAGTNYKEHEDLDSHHFPWELRVMISSGSSGGKGKDYPLPLVTRSFQKGDFSLELLAEILSYCHKEKPTYTPTKWNCYWYAERVFESHRVRIGRFKDNPWRYISWKKKMSKIADPERWGRAIQAAAAAFKGALPDIPVGNPGGGDTVKQLEHDPDAFLDALREEISKELAEITEDEKDSMEAGIADYHASVENSIAAEIERDDFEANLAIGKKIAYDQGWNHQSEPGPGEEFLVGPKEDELLRLEQTLFAFLGRLSVELQDSKS